MSSKCILYLQVYLLLLCSTTIPQYQAGLDPRLYLPLEPLYIYPLASLESDLLLTEANTVGRLISSCWRCRASNAAAVAEEAFLEVESFFGIGPVGWTQSYTGLLLPGS